MLYGRWGCGCLLLNGGKLGSYKSLSVDWWVGKSWWSKVG